MGHLGHILGCRAAISYGEAQDLEACSGGDRMATRPRVRGRAQPSHRLPATRFQRV